MQVGALAEQLPCGLCQPQLTAGAVLYVEHKVAIAVVAVADKRAARHIRRIDLDRFDVDAVIAEPVQVYPAEVVFPDAADDAASLTEFCDLVDEDRRRTARQGPDQPQRLAKTIPTRVRHDLHQDLTESYDLEHLCLRPLAQLPRATGSHVLHSAVRLSFISTPAVERSRLDASSPRKRFTCSPIRFQETGTLGLGTKGPNN